MLSEIHDLLRSDGIIDVKDFEDKKYLRFSYAPRGKATALFYLDYSDDLPLHKSDLDKRQSEILSKDYFENQNLLQWNMYLYFLLDEEKFSGLSRSDLSTIESDVNYAKKRVTSLSRAKELIPFSKILSAGIVTPDMGEEITSKWIERLAANNLDEVFDENAPGIDEALRRYEFNQQPKKVVIDSAAAAASVVAAPDFIEHLEVKRFRKLKPDTYRFAQFNLFEGPNGTGKTSCLEAIELVMCGKIKRLVATEDSDSSPDLTLKYRNDRKIDRFESNKPGKYREREKAWYGVATKGTQSNLCKTFALHNFYNTDAAFTFASNNELTEVWRSLEAISIGEKASALFRRIEGFESRFKRRKTELSEELKQARDFLLDLQAKVDAVKSAAISLPTENKIFLSGVALIFDGGSFTSVSQEDFSALRSIAKSFLGRLKTLEGYSPILKAGFNLTINLELAERIESALRRLAELVQKESGFEFSIVSGEQKIKSEQSLLDLLIELEKYLISAPNILELHRQITALDLKVQHAENSLVGVDSIDLLLNGYDGVQIDQAISGIKKEIDSGISSLKAIEQKVLEMTQKNKAIESLTSEIKALGRRYLDLQQSTNACPLCETSFEFHELQKRIDNISAVLLESVDLSALKKSTEAHISELRSKEESLVRLKNASNRLGLPGSGTVASIQLAITDSRSLISQSRSEVGRLREEVAQLSRNGFSVDVRHSLEMKLRASGLFSGLAPDQVDLGLVKSAMDSKALEIKDLRDSTNRHRNEQLKIAEEILNSALSDEVKDFPDLKEKALERLRQVESFLTELKGLLSSTPMISRTASVLELKNALISVTEEIERFESERIAEQSNLSAFSSLKDSKLKAESNQNELEVRFQRIEIGYACLSDIVTNLSTKEAVEAFYRRNKTTIVEVFKAIHTPKEFDDILLGNKEVSLLSNGVQRTINQMSTGQRSALVLSFFFGMHLSSLGAPKIIMFDDPVAFVDDLNVLTFLDFLREFCLTLNRQIFFSTANRKLAALIRKKFGSLGSDFASFETLKRPLLADYGSIGSSEGNVT